MRKLVALLPVALFVVPLVGLIGCPVMKIWDDGRWELRVNVVAAPELKIRAVVCESYSSVARAHEALPSLYPPGELPAVSQVPFTGKALIIHIPTSERIVQPVIPIWRSRRFRQYRAVAIAAIDEDRARLTKVVEIPDLREMQKPRQIDIHLP